MTLTREKAKEFFGSLYDHQNAPDLNEFESAALRLMVRMDASAPPGDRALGLLMLNHLMSAPQCGQARRNDPAAAPLMNIKESAVERFGKELPAMPLDSLIESAKRAGHEVDVLPGSVANSVPRSAVGC